MKRTLGVCYYPEHWPEEIWDSDARRMAEAGLTWVRIGEFAWSRMEPEPGQMAFDWLDRAIDVLGRAGLKVVLGTPTATPPIWMIEKHPDMLARDAAGHVRQFGSRRHYCFSHEGYRNECRRIAGLLGDRYGSNPYVAAWQIDNEYACHDTGLSYSDAARFAFQDWLAQKYQSPDALNRAWGNVFWSMEYRDFAEVGLPNLTVTEPNPSHVWDFRRFSSEQVVRFNRAQVEALRSRTDAPLIHNYMGRTLDFDHFDVGADLDVASWDSYPLGFLEDRNPADEKTKARFARQGDPDFQAFHHDLYRAVGHGRWWVMEQQPGPVNWAAYNPAPLPGMVRLWTWEAFAHGAEAVCYFRWRQAPFAQEQMHAGLLRPDDQPAPALAEAAEVSREIADMPEVETSQASVAILFDYASDWAWTAQPQGAGFTYFDVVFSAYQALRRLGLSIDIVDARAPDLTGYAMVCAPAIATLSSGAIRAVSAFADQGGTVLAGPRTHSKTADMGIPNPLPPNLPGLDATVVWVETLPAEMTVPVDGGGAFKIWSEQVETSAVVKLEKSDGAPALLSSGNMHYVAGWPDDALWDRILTQLADDCGLTTEVMPDGIRIRDTRTHRFAFNYGPETAEYRGAAIPSAGVQIWPK